jgi:aspartate kinase
MKFGGTSVEDPAAIRRTAAIVANRVAQGKQPIVVVSAMAKVTDQLLRAAAIAAEGDRTGALAISSRLRSRHRDTAAALVTDSAALVDRIDRKFDSLDEILRGLAAILELTPRVSDLIVSFGELFSSRIVAAAFRELGINSVHVDARQIIITDSQFQKAIPQDALIEERAPKKLLPSWAASSPQMRQASTPPSAAAAQTLPLRWWAARCEPKLLKSGPMWTAL